MAESPGASVALFRAFSMPGRKPRGEWIAPAIDVGTRSTCALNLNDPVVAEHHCTFRANAAGFAVEDLGSATGTWHNGIAVAGSVQLSSGDQVVIGVTRLSLEIKSEAERAVLEIQVEEASFHYQKPKSGEFHSDADEWVRSEVRFGRIPAVRKAAWLAGFVALISLVFVFTTETGEKLLQPGSLDGSHAAFFASDPEAIIGKNAALSPAFVAARERIAHESCKVCHASSQPGDVASCVACHKEMATRHPFLRGDATADARLAAGVEKPSDGCRLCHDVQHAGLSPSESIAAARARIREGTEEANPGWGVCTSCHVSGLLAAAETMPRVRELAALLVDAMAKPATDRHEYAFDEFSHQAHLNPKGRAIDCAVCHVEAPAGGEELSADFRAVAFSNCAACHVAGMPIADELPGIPSAELKSLRKELEAKKMLVTMSWHGRGDQCLACHAEAGKPELQQATREAATKTYGIVRMGHTEHANAAKGSKADCAVCHGDMKTLAGGAKSEGKEFLHGSHVETLWPASAADQARITSESCIACHSAQWQSDSLAQSTDIVLAEACKTCHADPARPQTKDLVSERVVDTEKKTATQFSHALHQDKIEGGCFACHAFQGADDSDPRARPFVPADVLNCTKCHSDHQEIAGGACTFCHPANSAGGGDSGLQFRGEKPSRMDWPAAIQFKHFGGSAERGHRSFVTAAGTSSAQGCGKCHDLENLRQATAVKAVTIPGARGTLCIDCHANNRGWFHWTLPDPSSAR